MYSDFEVCSPFLIGKQTQHLHADKAPHPLPGGIYIVGGLHIVKALVLRQLGAEPVCRHGLLYVIVASSRIGFIDCLGAGLAVGLETNIALRLQKLDHIVATALDRLHILSGLARNAELIVVPNQPVQTLQTPEKMPSFSCNSLSTRNGSSARPAGRPLVVSMIWRRKKPSDLSCRAFSAPFPKQRKRTYSWL